jgi:putative transposase
VIQWHRSGFRLYWRWKSRTTGRPRKDLVVRDLIREMSRDNPIRGGPRIRAELREPAGEELLESVGIIGHN